MGASLNTYLKDLSYKYYLKKDSNELSKINNSKDNLFNNLDAQLGTRIKRRFIFGSFDRDTILPRNYDTKSDIDIMVVFNHTEYERTPETYRNWLKTFADNTYAYRYGSEVVKTFPTVTIRLNNINYDLVPAMEEEFWLFQPNIHIPSSGGGWQQTNPNDVKEKLVAQNTRYNSIVKPIIRLMKAWNSNKSYPYDSYELELIITDMNFSGDNYETGFFYAVDSLSTSWNDTQTKRDKVESLQYNISQVKYYLDQWDLVKAKSWLHRVLPY